MPEEIWDRDKHAARMIPVTGLRAGKPKSNEQEIRATSALLAVLGIVREFADALLGPIGAPTGKTVKVDGYVETPYRWHTRTIQPDGLIRVTGRGGRSWTALVETKTGTNTLQKVQLDRYLEIAGKWNYDAVITISNEIPPVVGDQTLSVGAGQIPVRHLPWQHVLTVASQQREHFGVADPEQAWILAELIRYMDHPNSGVADTFATMGRNWARVRSAAQHGTLASTGDELRGEIHDIVNRFDALLRFAALQLSRSLGAPVEVVVSAPQRADPMVRTHVLAERLLGSRELAGAIRIRGIDRTIAVAANFLTGRIHFSSDIPAPAGTTQNRTRVKWLLSHLPATSPRRLTVESFAAGARSGSGPMSLEIAHDDPSRLLPAKPKKLTRVTWSKPMGLKGNSGNGSFAGSITDGIKDFYRLAVEPVPRWKPPQTRRKQPSRGTDALPSQAPSTQRAD